MYCNFKSNKKPLAELTQPGVDLRESCKDNKTLFAVPVDLLKS
jgi:hypothetical protein